MILLGSYDSAIVVIKDVRTAWTAKTQCAPIFVTQAKFDTKDGLIVTLSDNGFLQVSYLGTEQLTSNAVAN